VNTKSKNVKNKNGGNAKRKIVYATSMSEERDETRNAVRNTTNSARENVIDILRTTPIRAETSQYAA